MKGRILNIALILTSLIGYLEWGGGNSMFLIQGEIDVISKLFTEPGSVLHPFTLLPLVGQVILIGTLFQKAPGKWPTFAGMFCIGILLVLMFAIGLMEMNLKILISTLPFIVMGILVVKYHRSVKTYADNPV